MNKYIVVFQNSLYEYLAYRLNFILWRIRILFFILMNYFLWEAVSSSGNKIFGYSQSQILTYVLLTIFLNGIVFSTQTVRVAEEIQRGDLNMFLLRPINYFVYIIFRDIPDKSINTLFSLGEFGILFFLLSPPLFVQQDIIAIIVCIAAITCAVILYFEMNMILSLFAFWIHDVWSVRFLLFILISFLAGNYFPLDIFPGIIAKILHVLPFGYLLYFPLKLYLGTSTNLEIINGFFIVGMWIILLFFLMGYLWRKGLRAYTAVGQ